MSTVMAWTFPAGKMVDNVETLGAVATKTWTVPSNKRWLVIGGYLERDQNATLDLKITDNAGKTVLLCPQIAAGSSNVGFGVMNTDSEFEFSPIPLDAGMKIVVTWGAAQTTPEIACLVLEVDG